MSLLDEVNRECEAGTLHRVTTNGRKPRALYLSDEIYGLATLRATAGMSRQLQRRWDRAYNVDLRRFADGKEITVRAEIGPRRQSWDTDNSHLARLDPPSRGNWELRSIATEAMRFFGAFGGQDWLILLLWRWKRNLRTRPQYDAAVSEFEQEWNRRFRGEPPLRNGDFPDDYLTGYRSR